jgi:hypothetical protein
LTSVLVHFTGINGCSEFAILKYRGAGSHS